jgi:hypothetical protein
MGWRAGGICPAVAASLTGARSEETALYDLAPARLGLVEVVG